MASILVIDDERSMRDMLQIMLEENGHLVHTAEHAPEAQQLISQHQYELIISDLRLPKGSGLDILTYTQKMQPDCQTIIMTAYATAENAVEAMKLGAYDYQIKPFKLDEFNLIVNNALEKQYLLSENKRLKQQLQDHAALKRIVGTSPAMKNTLHMVKKVALTKASILIQGESGTGKELIARAIHELSARKNDPFIAVNCGAIPETLMESELFGHVKGSFTGADKDKAGVFEAANNGTLFLDEIADLPLSTQVKLLRVLQEKSIRRIGESIERPVDVRVLTATNKDLKTLVNEENFREDLFYRLNVVRLDLPALRERKEDIPMLAKTFLIKHTENMGLGTPRSIESQALDALQQYDYPGNIRELENIIERGVALTEHTQLQLKDLPQHLQPAGYSKTNQSPHCELLPIEDMQLDNYLENIEKQALQQAMDKCNGNKTAAAEMLGISFRSIRYRLKKLGITE